MKVFDSVDAVEVFVNESGSITIRQENRMGEDDALVVIPVDRVRDLCRALRQAEQDAKQG